MTIHAIAARAAVNATSMGRQQIATDFLHMFGYTADGRPVDEVNARQVAFELRLEATHGAATVKLGH
jgi:hypothetical protein